MNTSKQVNVMIGLLFVAFLAFGAYYATEAAREASARELQAEMMADRGAELYVANCRSCHGLDGLGPDEGGIGPRLNNVAFLVLDEENPFGAPATPLGEANSIHDFLFNTIACGRSNTAMPVWSEHYGGPLSDTQIGYLVRMMTDGRWDLVHEIGHHHDEALIAQHAAAIAMYGRPYDDPTLSSAENISREQKKAVDDAITAGTATPYEELTDAQKEAVDAALSKSILAPDPASLAVTTQNCGQYGAAVLEFRERNPFSDAPADGGDTDGETDPVALGQQAATQFGCTACHSVNGSAGVGPTWQGLAGHEVTLADGSTATVDDAYLRESIVDPNAKIAEGFQAGVMPQTFGTQLTPEQIDHIVAYINSLQ